MKQTGLDKAIAQLEEEIRIREHALAILKHQRAVSKPRVRLVKKDDQQTEKPA